MRLLSQRARRRLCFSCAALVVLIASAGLCGAQSNPNPSTHYYYRFASDRFLITKLEIEFDSAGQGKLRFKEQDTDEVENPISLKPETVASFAALFVELNFLKSQEVYQTPKDFSHMGTATVRLRQGEEEREVTFNYTANKTMLDLWQRFRSVENQEYWYFKLDVALHYQQLDVPNNLKVIGDMLNTKRIAEPSRFLPILHQIADNDQMIALARTTAQRMIKQIEATTK